jgi:hypothetical protein
MAEVSVIFDTETLVIEGGVVSLSPQLIPLRIRAKDNRIMRIRDNLFIFYAFSISACLYSCRKLPGDIIAWQFSSDTNLIRGRLAQELSTLSLEGRG